MIKSQLESAFETYFAEMEMCRKSGCYLALLHIVLVLPDICAALASPNGEGGGTAYIKWCNDHLPGALSPTERWEMRCALLHQGKTLPDSRARGRYRSFSFMPPGGAEVHQIVSADGEQNLTLDVATTAGEIERAINTWFDFVLQPGNGVLANVRQNLPTLIKKQPKAIPGHGPLPPTMSSTG